MKVRAGLFVLLVAGCAHTHAGGDDEAPMAQAPEARAYQLVDGETGAALDDAAFARRLGDARVVYVGEQHPDPVHHFIESEIERRLFAVEPSLGVGFEMLPKTLAAPLADFVAGTIDEPTFLARVGWQDTWGFPFGLYRPLFVFCRDHHLPAFALNAPRALTRAVAKQGLDGLSAEDKQQLPAIEPGPAAHREFAREAFGAHARSRFTDQRFEKFYAAQLVWDETMADSVTRALAGAGAPHKMLVIAGEGHTRRFAIPARAARRGATPSLLVLAIAESELADARATHVADVLAVIAETPPAQGSTPTP